MNFVFNKLVYLFPYHRALGRIVKGRYRLYKYANAALTQLVNYRLQVFLYSISRKAAVNVVYTVSYEYDVVLLCLVQPHSVACRIVRSAVAKTYVPV